MLDNGQFTPRNAAEAPIENRASFYKRIELFPRTEQLRTRMAYDIAKTSHRFQDREGGERHFEHARAVALILFDECRLRDSDFLIAGLLHDTVEDSTIWGSASGLSNTDWLNEARLRIVNCFGPFVADSVVAVSKPRVDGIEITDESQVLPAYLDQLRKAPPEGKVLKLSDVLHNSRTLHYRKPEKQIEVAHKNLEGYLPVLQAGSEMYAAYSDWMLMEIRDINQAYLDGTTEHLRPDQVPGRQDLSV